jgi:hypothetical protein
MRQAPPLLSKRNPELQDCQLRCLSFWACISLLVVVWADTSTTPAHASLVKTLSHHRERRGSVPARAWKADGRSACVGIGARHPSLVLATDRLLPRARVGGGSTARRPSRAGTPLCTARCILQCTMRGSAWVNGFGLFSSCFLSLPPFILGGQLSRSGGADRHAAFCLWLTADRGKTNWINVLG